MEALASLALTVALVLITGYYAWQNRQMVKEAAAARSLQVMPSLALQWVPVGPMHALVRVINLGLGAALDCDLTIEFVPIDKSGAHDLRVIRTSAIAQRESREFWPGANFENIDVESIAATFDRVELRGTVLDVTGTRHQVCDDLPDLAKALEAEKASQEPWVDDYHREKRLTEELGKGKLAGYLKDIARQSERIADELKAAREARPSSNSEAE